MPKESQDAENESNHEENRRQRALEVFRYDMRSDFSHPGSRTIHIQVKVVDLEIGRQTFLDFLVENVRVQIGEPSKHFRNAGQGGC